MPTWSTYRLWPERLLFGLSLLGMFIVVHLGLQEQRGFDRGCLGVSDDAAATTFDCAAVVQSDAGALLGVSNVVWGFLFYAAVAVLTFLVARATMKQRPTLTKLRAGLLGSGVLYTLYLLYVQFVQLDAFCALCLASAVVVGALAATAALPLLYSSSSSTRPMSDSNRRTQYKSLGLIAGVAVLLMVGNVFYFTQTAPASGSPATFAGSSVEIPDQCQFAAEQQPVEQWQNLVRDDDPIKGNADAPVTVIEFFDPNCPHCATMHEIMEVVIPENSDKAKFIAKPFPLWDHSIPQIAALYAAAEEDKFHDLLDAQYENQSRNGLSVEQLVSLGETIGMDDPERIRTAVEEERYEQRIMHQRQQGIAAGVSSTPTILINGHFVSPESRSPECFDAFISAAHDAKS